MSTALAEGGKLLWIAPSGGRDRRDPATNITVPSSFDPAAVELMRALLAKAGRPGHLYPFAMYSYDLMPPPDYVEKDVGESRVTNYTGCGVSVLPALDVDALLSGEEDKVGVGAAGCWGWGCCVVGAGCGLAARGACGVVLEHAR